MTKELITVPGKWELTYNYTAGETVSRFLTEIRDNARIMATKCPKCLRVIVPPRSYCERCFISIKDNWVELSPRGSLEAFTIVSQHFEDLPEPPYVICYVKLEGATTAFPQFLSGVDLSDEAEARRKLKVGMPVRLVFKGRAEREGRITDFRVELA